EKLALEPRHVHTDRTLRLASPALEAEVEGLVNAIIPEARFSQAARHGEAQRVGSASRRMRFFTGNHIRRAHGPGEFFAAGSNAAAHFDRAAHATVFGVVKPGNRFGRLIALAETQVRGERGRIDDLTRIQDSQWIEGLLDLAERLVKHGTEHLPHERAAHEAIAVFAGKGAAEFEHEIRYLLRDSFKLSDTLRGFEIDDRPHVQAAYGRMGINPGRGFMPANDLHKAGNKI